MPLLRTTRRAMPKYSISRRSGEKKLDTSRRSEALSGPCRLLNRRRNTQLNSINLLNHGLSWNIILRPPSGTEFSHGLGQKQRSGTARGKSGVTRDSGPARPFELLRLRANSGSVATLFDHLVGAGEDRLRDCEAERSGSLEIDDQLKPGWLLDRQIGGAGTLEYLVDVLCGLPPY